MKFVLFLFDGELIKKFLKSRANQDLVCICSDMKIDWDKKKLYLIREFYCEI